MGIEKITELVLGDDRMVRRQWIGASLKVLCRHSELVRGTLEQPWNGGVVELRINVGHCWYPTTTMGQIAFLDHVTTGNGNKE